MTTADELPRHLQAYLLEITGARISKNSQYDAGLPAAPCVTVDTSRTLPANSSSTPTRCAGNALKQAGVDEAAVA